MEARTYNLRELCREADVTERTVRYYIKEGLLPPPSGSGPFSRYTFEHWLRLLFIKRLKDEYLPLSEIKNLLDSRSLPELAQLAQQAQLIASPGMLQKGYGSQSGPSDPLVSLIRRGTVPGSGPDKLMLRQQMAPVPMFEPLADLAADTAAPESAEWSQAAAAPEADGTLPVESRPAESRPALPPDYTGPGHGGRPLQAQAFRSRQAAPGAFPPGAPQGKVSGTMAGSAAANPTPAGRAMKFSASFAANEMPPAVHEAAVEAYQAAEPEAPAMALMSMAAAPDPVPAPPAQPEEFNVQTWERIQVAPGLELHIEKRIAEANRPALAALLQAARRIFGQKEI